MGTHGGVFPQATMQKLGTYAVKSINSGWLLQCSLTKGSAHNPVKAQPQFLGTFPPDDQVICPWTLLGSYSRLMPVTPSSKNPVYLVKSVLPIKPVL